MGSGCSAPKESKEKAILSKTSLRQGLKKVDKPQIVTNKDSTVSVKDDNSRLKPDQQRKWVQPLPTPLPKGPLLITPDLSSYTVTTSTEEGVSQALEMEGRAEPAEGGVNGGGAGFLNVSTLQSGHSSVASDALSATGFSTHSSNSMSLSSSLSTNIALTPSGLHKWKLPPRLESLPDQLQRLLLGHPDSLFDLVSRPNIINLRIVAPEEDYMKERLLLWSDVIAPLRLVCAERGFALDVQDDLWARSSLPDCGCKVLDAYEAEVDIGGEVLAGHIGNPTDVNLMLLTPSFSARLPPSLSHEDYMMILVYLPDSASTALLHALYANNANLDPQRYELKVSEVSQHDEVKVTQLVGLMMEAYVTQGGDVQEQFPKFRTDYRKAVEKIIQNKQVLAENTVVLKPACLSEEASSGGTNGTRPGSLGVHSVSAPTSRPHSPYMAHSQQPVNPFGEHNALGEGKVQAVSAASIAATITATHRSALDVQIDAFCSIGPALSSINLYCPGENIIQVLPRSEQNMEPESDQPTDVKQAPCFLDTTICSAIRAAVSRLVETIIDQREDARRQVATGVPRSIIEELVTQTQHCRRLAQPHLFMTPSPGPPSPSRPLLESPTLNSLKTALIADSEEPVIVYGPPGWGLSTLAAQLVNFTTVSFPSSLVIYRFMGISPDSQTLLSTLLSIMQQLDTILGPLRPSNIGSGRLATESLSTENLLQDITRRSTNHMPIFLFLEGVTLYSRKLSELEVMTLSCPLPKTTKIVLLSSDADVIGGLRAKAGTRPC
ncbi:hypothetical protein EGW08_005317 [Elysia chlorotica]|uniref:NACHT domain-containing protein n=1 Tax=Elysia chlorotica TaxID=188477 RepID=A0A433TZB4_ELYCH|nr:hypothetical protein EGW08_005317 [Elysia chlorotica]